MADAKSVADVGVFNTALGGLTKGLGGFLEGMSQSSMYQYQAGVAKANQQIDEQNRQWSLQQGEVQAQQYGLQAGERIGQIKASQASAGFDVNSGSNRAVQESQQKITNLDLYTIRSNAAHTAYNYQVAGIMEGAQAEAYSAAGRNAMMGGIINAGSSILGAASSVSAEWLQGGQYGMWGGAGSGQGIAPNPGAASFAPGMTSNTLY